MGLVWLVFFFRTAWPFALLGAVSGWLLGAWPAALVGLACGTAIWLGIAIGCFLAARARLRQWQPKAPKL
jgi:hypothetical protein